MEEIGVVSRLDAVNAEVIVERKGACEHCTAGTCDVSGDKVTIEAINEAGAVAGQRVRVRMKPLAYVKGSALFYGIPALALIAGAVLGQEIFSQRFQAMDPEGVAAITAFAFFAISLAGIRLVTRKVGKSMRYQPVIEEILED